MGDVYQATDSKLGRSVAIKLLPEGFTHDAERAARFEREARVLASLNHPNIAGIHGIEESGGRKFLAMELVPGETLAERIKRDPIPAGEALSLAMEIARGLEAAHEKGIIHRDLKPANIKITPQGQVKVLDFGLAKASTAESANGGLSNSPTLSLAATNAGLILGTAAYMSPEQASGKPADKRTDIWSFGAVVWEMLCGRSLFNGETVSHVLADVLRGPIDFQPTAGYNAADDPKSITAMSEPRRDEPIARYRRGANRNRRDVERTRAGIEDGFELRSATAKPDAVAGCGGVCACAVALGYKAYRADVEEAPVLRLEAPLPENAILPVLPIPVVSPDGKRVVFEANVDGKNGLWLRNLDSPETSWIPGTDGGSLPFWSPDGNSIAFFAQRRLKRIEIQGGSAITIADTGSGTARRNLDREPEGRHRFRPQRCRTVAGSSRGRNRSRNDQARRRDRRTESWMAVVSTGWTAFSIFGLRYRK
jgi:serine/threonine-protein kinase